MSRLLQELKHSRSVWRPLVPGVASVYCCIALTTSAATNAPPSSLSDDTLIGIKFDQKLNSQVNPELVFRDEQGKAVKLAGYFDRKPLILNLGYYECPMLCSLVLNGMVESLLGLKLDIGNEFDVICVSIDPSETPELAAAKKRTYLKRYGRAGADSGWHFLTGDAAAIEELSAQVGFRYAYDPVIKEYAHPSGLIILTPDGKVARYFFGIDFPAKEMAAALRTADDRKVGSPIEQFVLLCFHYSPLTGKYGDLIMAAVRVSGVATLLALGGILVVRARRKRPARLEEAES
jgi:protein SCO1/2